MEINDLTGEIIQAAIEVHRTLGPGLLESTYEECLCHELELRKIPHERQKELPINYKGRISTVPTFALIIPGNPLPV
jgi:GxxExxY protein